MFRKVLMLMAIVLVFSACEVKAVVVHSTWVGCEDGMWGDANNWNPAIVPDNGSGNTFVVTIDTRSCPPGLDVRLQQNRTIDQLDTYGDVDLEKRLLEDLGDIVLELAEDLNLTLSVNELLTNHGSLGAEVIISGNVTNTTGATFRLDDMEIEGDLYNQPGATMDVDYEVDVEQGGLENAGLIEIAPSGEIYVNQHINNVGQIIIYGGECGADEEIFDNNSTGVIKGFGFLFAEQLLRNKGAIYAYGGSLAVLSEGPLLNSGLLSNYPLSSLQIRPTEDVNNYGTIEVHAGGGMAFDCNVVNEPNATIQLLGGILAASSITQSAEANFAGFGGITGDVLIDPNGIIRLIGSTNVVGNMEIADGATLQINDGTTLITGHTDCNNGTIHMIGGRVICQGGLTNNNCNIIWEPGTYTNMADFNLDGTVNFKDFAYFGDTWLWKADWY